MSLSRPRCCLDRDVDALIEAGGRVRLCKGAYKEPHSVAYAEKADVDEAYERLMLRLMRQGNYPALATHDVRLIKRAVEAAKAEGISRDSFEFQMPRHPPRPAGAARGAGYRV
ncbi:MAG: proline dehydrogenase family protein [Chloroflexota bacterium]